MKTVKVIGLLALVFLAGFAGGIVATRVVVRRMVEYAIAHPQTIPVNMERNLNLKLRLDPQQHERVHEILKDSHEKMRALREEFQPKFNTVVLETRTNISAVLRPGQEDRFEQFLAENRQFLPLRELPPPPPKKN